MHIVKAHAYGNDFLLLEESQVPPQADRADLARRVCDRHRGIGADGLIVYRADAAARAMASMPRASMRLLNADGSRSEVSGNGVRCLAVLLAREHTSAREVADVTRAGDTVISTRALSLAARATLTEAAPHANESAGIVVARFGPATVGALELLRAMERVSRGD
jgi:diaminopimelate epimerase